MPKINTSISDPSLSIAFNLIIALIATTPILLLMQGSMESVFVAFVSSCALVFGARNASRAELERLARTVGRFGLLLAVPAAWIVVQLVPLPFVFPAHQIWTSAAAAMPDLSFGHITMNVTDTVRALGLYCGWLVLVLATMVATVDRRRAALCLVALVLATTAIAAAGIVFSFRPDMLTIDARTSFSAASAAAAALGCVLSLAAIQRLINRRRRTHLTNKEHRTAADILLEICAVSAFVTCLLAAALLSSTAWIAALLGVLIFAAVALMNRFGVFKGSQQVIVSVFALIAASILLARSAGTSSGSFLVGLVSSASTDSIATADRILRDSTWFGTGAGTYETLIPIYEELGRPPPIAPPSLALKLGIEWGWASPAILTICVLLVVSTLVRASMLRGRDSFYAAGAAACLASLTFQAYGDSSLLNPAVGLLSAAIVGLAFAQATGRSASK